MLLIIRSSLLSSTRKLFERTIRSVKSLFTRRGTTYPRLHNAPSFNLFSCVGCHGGLERSYSQSYRELDRFYFEYTNRWGNESDFTNNIVVSSTKSSKVKFLHDKMEENIDEDENDDKKKEEVTAYEDIMLEKDGIERRCLVVEKLMDMEMMEPNNLEHVQDIEEVLHLYSHLTCRDYNDIFDKFAIDMHSNLFGLKDT